jgi:GNAT superfamily N-acetyltransferase
VIEICTASTRDARAIAALRVQVARGMTRQFGKGHWSACPTVADVTRQIRASHVLLARQDKEIVGTVRLVEARQWAIDSSAFTPASIALYVLGLATAPDHRRRGIGRALIEAAKAKARTWPAQALWLDAYDHPAGAGAFYRACGFREVGPGSHGELQLIFFEWRVD